MHTQCQFYSYMQTILLIPKTQGLGSVSSLRWNQTHDGPTPSFQGLSKSVWCFYPLSYQPVGYLFTVSHIWSQFWWSRLTSVVRFLTWTWNLTICTKDTSRINIFFFIGPAFQSLWGKKTHTCIPCIFEMQRNLTCFIYHFFGKDSLRKTEQRPS